MTERSIVMKIFFRSIKKKFIVGTIENADELLISTRTFLKIDFYCTFQHQFFKIMVVKSPFLPSSSSAKKETLAPVPGADQSKYVLRTWPRMFQLWRGKIVPRSANYSGHSI